MARTCDVVSENMLMGINNDAASPTAAVFVGDSGCVRVCAFFTSNHLVGAQQDRTRRDDFWQRFGSNGTDICFVPSGSPGQWSMADVLGASECGVCGYFGCRYTKNMSVQSGRRTSGCAILIQGPSSLAEHSFRSLAIAGKMSRSMLVKVGCV